MSWMNCLKFQFSKQKLMKSGEKFNCNKNMTPIRQLCYLPAAMMITISRVVYQTQTIIVSARCITFQSIKLAKSVSSNRFELDISTPSLPLSLSPYPQVIFYFCSLFSPLSAHNRETIWFISLNSFYAVFKCWKMKLKDSEMRLEIVTCPDDSTHILL